MLAGALLASASSAAVPDEGITMAAAFDMAKETAPALLTSKYQVDIAVADRTSVERNLYRSFPCLDSGQKIKSSMTDP